MYASTNMADEVIEISPTDHQVASKCTDFHVLGCKIRIDVYGYEPSKYKITCSTSEDIIQLQDRNPVTGFVDYGNFDHYVIYSSNYDENVSITVTPLSGDPDLFVSVSCIKIFRVV